MIRYNQRKMIILKKSFRNYITLQWTPRHRHTSVGQSAKTYINQLCADTECHPEDLTNVMANRDRERERERERKRERERESMESVLLACLGDVDAYFYANLTLLLPQLLLLQL